MLVDGTHTYVETMGEGGVPTLFLHGFGGSADSFRPVYSHIRGKIVTLDLWGFGRSAGAPDWTIYDYAERVVRLLDDMGIPKVNLVAHSFGGRIALVLMAHYGGRVSKCVLADSAGLKPRRGLKYRWRVLKYRCYRRFAKNFDPDKYGSPDYLSLNEGMRKTFKNVVNQDLTYTLKYIQTPTLIIFGDRDRDTPVYMAKKLHRGIADSGLILYENCGHFAYLEKTFDFAVTVNTFFQ